jgi:hypothetical protein
MDSKLRVVFHRPYTLATDEVVNKGNDVSGMQSPAKGYANVYETSPQPTKDLASPVYSPSVIAISFPINDYLVFRMWIHKLLCKKKRSCGKSIKTRKLILRRKTTH